MGTETSLRAPGQFRSILRAVHPRQALAFAMVVGVLVALLGRHTEFGPVAREVLAAGAAVLVAQLIMGLANDLSTSRRTAAPASPASPWPRGSSPRKTAAS